MNSFGIVQHESVEYIHSDLVKFSKHRIYSQYNNIHNKFKMMKKHKEDGLIYDLPDDVLNRKYDLVIVDGPSFHRYASIFISIHCCNNGGFIFMEAGRKTSPCIEAMGIDVTHRGRSMIKSVTINGKKYKVYSANFFRYNKEEWA